MIGSHGFKLRQIVYTTSYIEEIQALNQSCKVNVIYFLNKTKWDVCSTNLKQIVSKHI